MRGDRNFKSSDSSDPSVYFLFCDIALLRRAKSFVPRHVLEKMYNAFIIPHFYYCSTVWYDGSKNKLTKMSKLQKYAARISTGESYDIRSNEVFQKLNRKTAGFYNSVIVWQEVGTAYPNYPQRFRLSVIKAKLLFTAGIQRIIISNIMK